MKRRVALKNESESSLKKSKERFDKAVENARMQLRYAYSELGVKRMKLPNLKFKTK